MVVLDFNVNLSEVLSQEVLNYFWSVKISRLSIDKV